MSEEWENDLLMEAEGLKNLLSLFVEVEKQLGQSLHEYGEYLDEGLVALLRRYMVFIHVLINRNFVFVTDGGKSQLRIEGLIKQLDDVMDEIKVFQAGLKTKDG